MNGAPDFTKFDRNEVDPYIDQAVMFHGQRGTFRNVNGTPTWMPGYGANIGNGIEDVTSLIAPGGGPGPQMPPAGGNGFPPPPSQGPGQGGPQSPPGGNAPQPPPGGAPQPPSGGTGTGTGTGAGADPSGPGPGMNPAFTAAFNSAFGQENYNPRLDFNRDNKIDFQDFYGEGDFGSYASRSAQNQPLEIDPSLHGYDETRGYVTTPEVTTGAGPGAGPGGGIPPKQGPDGGWNDVPNKQTLVKPHRHNTTKSMKRDSKHTLQVLRMIRG